MMGTDGDMLPLFWASAKLAHQHGVPCQLVVQPFQFETVVRKLGSSPLFCCNLAEETIKATQPACPVTFTPPAGGPPKVERAADADEMVPLQLRHAVFQTTGNQTEFHVWAPSDSAWNEKLYQEWTDLDKIAFKKSGYGRFLTIWQAVIAFSAAVSLGACHEHENGQRQQHSPVHSYHSRQ